MTITMYAARKKLPLEGVKVELQHIKIDEIDQSSGKILKVDKIDRQILLQGPLLSSSERDRLFEIANKCPVHRTLTQGKTVIQSSLIDELKS